MLWHPANPDAVTACVARARENARGVREQISSEMWEHLNRLHLRRLAHPADGGARLAARLLRPDPRGLARLPGRDEGDAAARRGVRVPRARCAPRAGRLDGAAALGRRCPACARPRPRPVSNARLSSLLKSCGAFEAFRKQESDDELRPERVVAFLLLERRLPRAVCFCLERALSAIRAISGEALRPERAIGRVFAELAFTELHSLDATTELLLRRVQLGIADAADEIAAGYFTTRIDPARPLRPAAAAAAAVILPRRAHDGVRVRRPDRGGLHGAAPASARGRRPALLLVPARHRAARACACASTATTSATPSTTSTCSSRTTGSR